MASRKKKNKKFKKSIPRKRRKKATKRSGKSIKKPPKFLLKKRGKFLRRTKRNKLQKRLRALVKKTKTIEKQKFEKPELAEPRTDQSGWSGARVESNEPSIYKTQIKVIGIGGGGSSIINEIASRVTEKNVSFVAANTDLQALDSFVKQASNQSKLGTGQVQRLNFGQSLTQGFGTGLDPDLGRRAAESDKEKIRDLIKDADFCIFIVSLGGGTGSGAGPIFADIARSLGVLTLGIVTLPFEFEGENKKRIAEASLDAFQDKLNAIVVIPNEKIFEIIEKKTPIKKSFNLINKILTESIGGLLEIITQPGLINIDFSDLKTTLEGYGNLTYISASKTGGIAKAERAVKKLLSNPLYNYTAQDAKAAIFSIFCGETIGMTEIEGAAKNISQSLSPHARIIFGIVQEKTYKDKIKIILLAVGCKKPEEKAIEETKEKVLEPESKELNEEDGRDEAFDDWEEFDTPAFMRKKGKKNK